MFSRLLQHPAWKWRGTILVSVLHKFVNYLLTYSVIYSPGPTQDRQLANPVTPDKWLLS